MATKSDSSKKGSEDKSKEEYLRERLSKEDDKLKKILIFMKNTIRESNLPWVSWKLLEDNAEKIFGTSRRPESNLWPIMEPLTYTLVEKEEGPKAVNPEFYEYKIGNAWVYIPAKMIELYCETE